MKQNFTTIPRIAAIATLRGMLFFSRKNPRNATVKSKKQSHAQDLRIF